MKGLDAGIIFPEGDGGRAQQEQESSSSPNELLCPSMPLTSAKHWEAGGEGSLTSLRNLLMQEAFCDDWKSQSHPLLLCLEVVQGTERQFGAGLRECRASPGSFYFQLRKAAHLFL